jgi:hypothetical protein
MQVERVMSRNLVFMCSRLTTSSAIPLQAWTGPWGSRRLRLPKFLDNRHMKVVRLSALGILYPQEIFLVLTSLSGWVDPRALERSEGLRQWKTPMTPSGIEIAPFWLEVQCLNKLCHCVRRDSVFGAVTRPKNRESIPSTCKRFLYYRNVQSVSTAYPGGLLQNSCPASCSADETTVGKPDHSHLVPRLRMRGGIPLLPTRLHTVNRYLTFTGKN